MSCYTRNRREPVHLFPGFHSRGLACLSPEFPEQPVINETNHAECN